MNRWVLISLLLLFALILAALWFQKYDEYTRVEIRAAMDIGSGATNLKVAKVDRNTDKIISQIFEHSIPVPYQKHLEQSTNNTFDREVMDQGVQAIQTLKNLAQEQGAKKIVAIATAAFRKADNAKEFAAHIEKQTGVKVRIIDQDEEGILAFRGALAITPFQPQNVVVWDIGGGSMQLTTLTDVGTYLVDKGSTASIPFKNALIQDILKKNIQQTTSPNPLNHAQMDQAVDLAAHLAQSTDPYIKYKLQTPTTHVVAVGSLFNYGIKGLVGQPRINQAIMDQSLMKLENKTDQELPGGPLAEVAVSNPLMVLGYMKGLNIQNIEILNVNNADGALTYPAYWSK